MCMEWQRECQVHSLDFSGGLKPLARCRHLIISATKININNQVNFMSFYMYDVRHWYIKQFWQFCQYAPKFVLTCISCTVYGLQYRRGYKAIVFLGVLRNLFQHSLCV